MGKASNIIKTIKIESINCSDDIVKNISPIVKRHIQSRCSARILTSGHAELTIELAIDSQIGPDGFHIEQSETNDSVRISGNGLRAILYGIGKFLRTSRYDRNGFIPGDWQGLSLPEKPVRGIYFASHFHNFYQDAPTDKIVEYLEDLALWGFNVVMVWYDMHHYTGIDDPDAQKMIQHLKKIMSAAKALDLEICLGTLANEAYCNSPEEMRAVDTCKGFYHVELCPNKPGACELMLKWFDEELDAFADLQPDYISLWPYDQGGCACESCKPWGANGFLKISEKKALLAKEKWPKTKIILSTWCFDLHGEHEGEWQGLHDAFAFRPSWCDYLFVDSHNTFPSFPLEKGVPGNLPMINFPEISMWEMHPWGGFGANPLPKRFNRLWQDVKNRTDGGFPYSEGIFEDMNKAIYASFYWNSATTAEEAIVEYASFEFSPDVATDVLRAVNLLEDNHGHCWLIDWKARRQMCRREMRNVEKANDAFEILSSVNSQLTIQAKQAWRWRILYLRALIDKELCKTNSFWATDECEKAFEELTQIYYAQNAEYKLAPPTIHSIAAMRTSQYPMYSEYEQNDNVL